MEGGRRQQRRRVLAPRAVDGGRHARSDGSVDRGRIRGGVSARRLQEEKETGGDAWSPRGPNNSFFKKKIATVRFFFYGGSNLYLSNDLNIAHFLI